MFEFLFPGEINRKPVDGTAFFDAIEWATRSKKRTTTRRRGSWEGQLNKWMAKAAMPQLIQHIVSLRQGPPIKPRIKDPYVPAK